MRALIMIFLLSTLAGCAVSDTHSAPPFYAPYAAMSSRVSAGRPADVLPASYVDYLVAPRWEKAVYTDQSFSAFTIYTYDAQRLSDRQGSYGYRYRWIIQSNY